jgi:hypothetical protein
MRIRYERSGGLVNIPSKVEVDSETLPAGQAKELKRLIEAADLFNQPAEPPASQDAPDQFQYEITVEDGKRRQRIRTTDTAASAELLGLFDWLNGLALAGLKNKMKKP